MIVSKRFFRLIALLLAAVLVFEIPSAYAANLDQLKKEQQENKEKLNSLNSSIKEKTSEISKVENEQKKLLDQISDIMGKIEETNKQINALNVEIEKTNGEIAELQKDIAALEKKIADRNALLEERARAIQVNGNVSYLDVLLGANSFVDFIDRFSAVTTLLEADRKIMREQKEDKQKLEDQKAILEEKKAELERDQQKLKSLKANLDSQKEEKRQLVKKLEAQQEKLAQEKKLLEEQYSEALSVDNALNSKIKAEQARLAEIARKEAEKRRAAQQAAKQQNGGAASGNLPAVSSGTWTNPTIGRLTSGFGWRDIGAGLEFHYGVDIANAAGTPIVAANDGVIFYAGPLSSYGNVIMITHIVNGATWTTVYAHLSAIQVSVGQSVGKGQQIGLMGSTGRSTGPHLHFEIHNGPWISQRANALNPLNYINY